MKTRAAFFSNVPGNIDYVYGKGRREKINVLFDVYPEIITAENFPRHAANLNGTEVIFSTWGMPGFDADKFSAMPSLKAVFYGAGATDYFARPFLHRDIIVCSAWQANAIPVAEFTVAQIILGLKGYFRDSRSFKSPEDSRKNKDFSGAFEERVALIGAGAIARKTEELLANYNVEVTVIPSRPERRTVSIEEAFKTAFVVSNHLPNRDDNRKVFTREHFLSMRPGAVFINTGRGAQVDEAGLIAAFKERPDLTALLDVTDPEPPPAGSELYTMPNIHLSSHIAGSLNNEVIRMADYMIADAERWLNGEPLQYRVSEDMLLTS
jgi:phosphoglycerate dehydrogenase-like enzyme